MKPLIVSTLYQLSVSGRSGVLLMASLLLSCSLLSQMAYASPLPNKPHVYVEGSATVEAVPDEMLFSVSLSHTAKTLGPAKEQVDRRSMTLIKLCKDMGIDSKDLSTTALRVMPSYEYVDGRRVPNGTTVSRDVDITLRDLSKYPAVMKAFVDADISKTINTTLRVSDEEVLTDRALVKALEDAKRRATRMAKAQEKKLGDVYSVSEFMTRRSEGYELNVSRSIVGQSSPEMGRAMMESRGQEPFEPGTMQARAQVFVVYLLK